MLTRTEENSSLLVILDFDSQLCGTCQEEGQYQVPLSQRSCVGFTSDQDPGLFSAFQDNIIDLRALIPGWTIFDCGNPTISPSFLDDTESDQRPNNPLFQHASPSPTAPHETDRAFALWWESTRD